MSTAALERNIILNATKFDNRDNRGTFPFRAFLFPGRIDSKPVNWTLAGIETHRDPTKLALLTRVADAINCDTFLSPSPVEFNGRICDRSELAITVDAGRGCTVRRGTNADGCLVKDDESYIASVGGCAILVMTHGDHMVAAHAGFRSLYDHTCMTTSKRHPDRMFESVVTSAAHALSTDYGNRAAKLDAHILFPLSPQVHTHSLDDKEHGESNKLMVQYCRAQWGQECGVEQHGTKIHVDTVKLIKAQCEHDLGMYPSQIHFNGIYADKIPYAYHTRSGPGLKDNRNLVVIQNTWEY